MKSHLTLSLAAVLAVLSTSVANSGDYNSGIVTKSPSEGYTDVEFGSGWYIRGDIGVNLSASTKASATRAARAGNLNPDADLTHSAGIGFGFIFNEYFRSDLTLDKHLGGSWSGGASGCGNDGLGVPYTGDCSSRDSGSFDSLNLMLNGYVHLGSYANFSPYVGAGAGVAQLNLNSGRSVANCTLDPGENCDLGAHSGATANPETLTGTQNYSNSEEVHFAYSLMAGFTYRIDEYWSTDIGYRYTNILADNLISSGGTAGTVQFDGVEISEVRAGLRYEIW